MTKKPKPRYPCPLCGHAMSARLEMWVFPSDDSDLAVYSKIFVKFTCRNSGRCGYEERTKAESTDEKTIANLLDEAASYRGEEVFKHGDFQRGNVGVNRRRHTGIYTFEPVELPKKGRK